MNYTYIYIQIHDNFVYIYTHILQRREDYDIYITYIYICRARIYIDIYIHIYKCMYSKLHI